MERLVDVLLEHATLDAIGLGLVHLLDDVVTALIGTHATVVPHRSSN